MAEDDARNGVPNDDRPDSDRPDSDRPGSDRPSDDGLHPEPSTGDKPSPDDTVADSAADPPLDETQVAGPLDETRLAGPPVRDAGPTGTGVLPPVGAEPPRWSARAQVPRHEVDEGYPDWQETEEQPARSVLAPVLITLCVILLAALIGLGMWLGLRDDTPDPVVTPPATASADTPAPTTAPPTTPPPTSAAPTTPAEVEIPVVRTLTFDQAVDRLTAAGFTNFRQVDEVSELPAGQVIGTNPPAGNTLRPDATVEIRVSTGPPETTSPTPTTEAD